MFPKPGTSFEKWWDHALDNVSAATSFCTEAYRWALECEKSETAFVQLAKSGGFIRLDALLLVAPAVGVFLASGDRRHLRSRLLGFALGGSPLVFWELFSLFYYGFPFPNTAYAKLLTGVPKTDLMLQGLRYLADSLTRDPLTLVTLAAALGVAFTGPRDARPRRLAMAAGIALYLLYIIWIGGDFKPTGRFILPVLPLLCIVLISLATGS